VKKSGYIMRISGQAPFSITLGKPELVQIDYNDVPVDMAVFNAGNIAKFSLPLIP
jgi:cytoskeleton protein RodZ